jgi:hypothetical protein
MNLMRKIISNGYILMLPILIWNLIFTSKLPPAYDPKNFNNDIPILIFIGENLFRSIIFILPLFMKLDIANKTGKQGFIVYSFGSLFYYLSWLMLIYTPNSLWSNSGFGFAAPAYTPIIWLIGISLMANSYYFKITYKRWHFIIPSMAFSFFHGAHAMWVSLRTI